MPVLELIKTMASVAGDKTCVHPSLDNSSRLIRIIHSGGSDILYVGDPVLLQYSGEETKKEEKSGVLIFTAMFLCQN